MIGEVIKELRELKGISQADFASICGVSPKCLNLIEADIEKPGFEMLNNIGEKLEIPVSILTFLSMDQSTIDSKEEYENVFKVVKKLLTKMYKEKIKIKN